jgi:hypothetical protein
MGANFLPKVVLKVPDPGTPAGDQYQHETAKGGQAVLDGIFLHRSDSDSDNDESAGRSS